MEFELRLHPDDAARLSRLRCVARVTQGRPRQQTQRIVWHDTARQELAASGLTLARERDGWCLGHLVPNGIPWPPAGPVPVVERAPEPDSFEHALPAPLVPVASFMGRLAAYQPTPENGAVALGVLRGALRAVTDEQPVCRLRLSGEERAVRDLALAIAQELRLQVPDACLAGEAFAMALGLPLPARHRGAPELPAGATIPDAFAFVVGHLTDVILHFATAALDPRAGPEPVHQMRVGVRRLRSCFAVFRPAVQSPTVERADGALKTLGKQLAPARDWDVFMTETAPTVLTALPDQPRLGALLRAADRRRREHHAALREFLLSPEFRRLGIELAWLAAARSWHEELDADAQQAMQADLAEFAAAQLQHRLDKLLRAGQDIETLDATALHGVRLRAKRLRYAAEVFAPLYSGKASRRFLHRLSRLQQHLGVANDAAVAGMLMTELGGPGGRHGYAVGLVEGFAAAHARGVRKAGSSAWDKFRRLPVFWE